MNGRGVVRGHGLVRRAGAIALRLAVLAGAVVFLGRGVAWRAVGQTLRGADLGLLGAVITLNGLMMAVRAARLQRLLPGAPPFLACFLAKLSASAINNLTPLRGGDVARVWMLNRHARISKTAAAAVAIVENLLELLALSALALPAVQGAPEQGWVVSVAPIVLAVAILLVLLLAIRGGGVGRLGALRARIEPGVEALRHPANAVGCVALSLSVWVIEAAMVVLTARAIGLPVSVSLAIVVLLGINVALALPSLPAGIGAFEAAVVFVLTQSGVQKEVALAFALLYHLVQVVPVTIAGAVVVSRLGVTLEGLGSARSRSG